MNEGPPHDGSGWTDTGHSPKANFEADPLQDTTGVPGLSTWQRVYLFVMVCFAIYVALLAAFTRIFS